MHIVTFSKARNHLKQVIDKVIEDADFTVITRRDASNAVIMSQETFDSLLETVHLLKTPANVAHLGRSIEQYRQGEIMANDLIDA